MRVLKITLLSIMYIILGFMLLFNLYNVVNKMFGIMLPNYFGYSFVCMSENSSLSLEGGRLLIVKRVSADNIEIGDLLVFKYDNELAVSKVIIVLDGGSVENGGNEALGGYITSSGIDDESGEPNASVPYDDVFGKVIGNYDGGNLLNYFTSWQFNIMLVTAFIIIVWTNIVILQLKITEEDSKLERKARFEQYMKSKNLKGDEGKNNSEIK